MSNVSAYVATDHLAKYLRLCPTEKREVSLHVDQRGADAAQEDVQKEGRVCVEMRWHIDSSSAPREQAFRPAAWLHRVCLHQDSRAASYAYFAKIDSNEYAWLCFREAIGASFKGCLRLAQRGRKTVP